MNKITRFQKLILKWIAKKIVVQGCEHRSNIISFYRILIEAAREEFIEDTRPTFNSFLTECHQEALSVYEATNSAEFICKCGKQKGWVTEDLIQKDPCPQCGRRYKGIYDKKKYTIKAIEV